MHRWTAKVMLLAILAPTCGPLAMALPVQPGVSHCQRKPVMTAMHCHHGMAMAPQPVPTEKTFRSLDRCCEDHDCCRSVKTSQWARLAPFHLAALNILIEQAPAIDLSALPCLDLFASDSARAPPRS